MTYKITFEFKNKNGEWRADCLNNDGKGFILKETREIVPQLRQTSLFPIRHIEIKENI